MLDLVKQETERIDSRFLEIIMQTMICIILSDSQDRHKIHD